MCNQSQIVQRIRVLGLLGQDLPVKLLGQLQPPGLVVLNGYLHRLIDGHLGHVDSLGVATYLRHMSRYAASTFRVNRTSSIKGDACIRGRRVARI